MKFGKVVFYKNNSFHDKALISYFTNCEFIESIIVVSQKIHDIGNINPDLIVVGSTGTDTETIALAEKLHEAYPKPKKIAFVQSLRKLNNNYLLNSIINCILLISVTKTELMHAVEHLTQNQVFYMQSVINRFDNSLVPAIQNNSINFSKRESEILSYICQGWSNSEIAEKLFLSKRTVETHRANLLIKAEVKNSIQLVIFAIRYNFYKV